METSDGEGPWDRFLPEPLGRPASEPTTASSFAALAPVSSDALAWQANRFSEDPQYGDEGPRPPERSPTEPIPFSSPPGTGLFVGALGDHCTEFALPEGRLNRRGYTGQVDGTEVHDGEIVAIGSTQLVRSLTADASSFSVRVLLIAPRCAERTRGARRSGQRDDVRLEFERSVLEIAVAVARELPT